MRFNGLAALVALLTSILLQSCSSENPIESWRRQEVLGGANPYATEQGTTGVKSGIGRLNNAQGTIEERKGYYYLRPLHGGHLWDLSNQSEAKKFANSRVSVWGFFNYDKGKIAVSKIYSLRNHSE